MAEGARHAVAEGAQNAEEEGVAVLTVTAIGKLANKSFGLMPRPGGDLAKEVRKDIPS